MNGWEGWDEEYDKKSNDDEKRIENGVTLEAKLLVKDRNKGGVDDQHSQHSFINPSIRAPSLNLVPRTLEVSGHPVHRDRQGPFRWPRGWSNPARLPRGQWQTLLGRNVSAAIFVYPPDPRTFSVRLQTVGSRQG